MTTRADSATALSDAGSVTSAGSSSRVVRSGWSSTRRLRTASSLLMLRPARAHRQPVGALSARYAAVSSPVNPVAPKSTMSNGRESGEGMSALSQSRTNWCRVAQPSEHSRGFRPSGLAAHWRNAGAGLVSRLRPGSPGRSAQGGQMSVLAVIKVPGDVSIFQKEMANRADEFEAIGNRAKSAGAIHHWFGIGDGYVMAIDEWGTAEQFQVFFGDPALQEFIGSIGGAGDPEVTITEAISSPDEF